MFRINVCAQKLMVANQSTAQININNFGENELKKKKKTGRHKVFENRSKSP